MTEQPSKTRKVVVVEDDEDFMQLVRMILADIDIEVISAFSGRQGLEAIAAHKPQVVILDLMLPDMNGWEVYMHMRQTPPLADIPVIILTVQGTRQDRTFGAHVAKVHEYLLKPCLPSQLRQSVLSALA